jgi:DNA-binding HxlR family transcriptional regulator
LLNAGDAFDGPAFVSDNRIIGKVRAETLRVVSVLGSEIAGQKMGKFERHRLFLLSGLVEPLVAPIDLPGEWSYAIPMTRTHQKVGYSPESKPSEYTPATAARGVEQALKILEGRWKLVILFHLFGGRLLRFSELEQAIPAISQKMLIQQLRQMERDGVVRRIVHHQVPSKVEYGLTQWGQTLCPALDALLKWAALREVNADASTRALSSPVPAQP